VTSGTGQHRSGQERNTSVLVSGKLLSSQFREGCGDCQRSSWHRLRDKAAFSFLVHQYGIDFQKQRPTGTVRRYSPDCYHARIAQSCDYRYRVQQIGWLQCHLNLRAKRTSRKLESTPLHYEIESLFRVHPVEWPALGERPHPCLCLRARLGRRCWVVKDDGILITYTVFICAS